MKGPAMTKVDLAESIQQRLDCPKKEALELVDEVIELLKDGIIKDGGVKISGFGSFNLRQKADRRGRNPQTEGVALGVGPS